MTRIQWKRQKLIKKEEIVQFVKFLKKFFQRSGPISSLNVPQTKECLIYHPGKT